MFGRFGIPELFFCGLGIAFFFFWSWMLVEAITKERPESQDRLIWTLVVLLGGPLGALIYLLVRRSARIKELGR